MMLYDADDADDVILSRHKGFRGKRTHGLCWECHEIKQLLALERCFSEVMIRLDLKNCLSLPRNLPNSGGADSKYFIEPLKVNNFWS